MRFPASISMVLGWMAVFAALVLVSCHLGQDEKAENVLTFSKHYETLSKFDIVEIAVIDPATGDTTVIFRGKVDSREKISSLEVPGWTGGPIQIVVSGFNAGNTQPVYVEQKKYDGKIRETDSVFVLVTSQAGLAAVGGQFFQIMEGASFPLPSLTITPSNLSDTGILWSSDRPDIAAVREGLLVAVSFGSAQVTAKLHHDTSKSVIFSISVQADPAAPQSIALDRDTLDLAQNGASNAFSIQVQPATANAQVSWEIANTSIAQVDQDGMFKGLLPGLTRVIATSKVRSMVKDTGYIRVSEPVRVTSLRFLADTATLYVGGTPLSLEVVIEPSKANQQVSFVLSDSSKARVDGRTLIPSAGGSVSVIVFSVEDPTKTDTLRVQIKQPILVQKVVASLDTLTLYVKGAGRALSAQVLPDSAPQGLQWKSLAQGVASVSATTGRVEPVSVGTAQIVASSQGDSTKKDTVNVLVKQDSPRLFAGMDTSLSAGLSLMFRPAVTQEYGAVVMFKWDLDGDQTWEDSSASLKDVNHTYALPKVYRARLFVRDTEGNEVIVVRTVTVVSGAAVSIEEPKDNSYTNKKVIPVVWYVNGTRQSAQDSATLVLGANVITRAAKDSAGKEFSHKVTVHLDTTAPGRPTVSGTSPTNLKPSWTWTSGGGGSGDYRFRLGDANFPAIAPTTRDSAHVLPGTPVSGTTYTLFVQERDLAGNWSPAGSLPIVYDETKPVVAIASPKASGTHFTASASITLSGTAAGPLPVTRVAFKVGAAAAVNATWTAGTWTTAAITLQEGVATLITVTAFDNANNQGEASLTLFHDRTPPAPPVITSGPDATTQSIRGTFGWNAGNDGTGGSGLNGRFRYNINGAPWKDTSAVLLSDLPLQEGNNLFSVQEQDQALNWSNAATRLVKMDTSRPILTLTSHTSPVSHASQTITLTGQVRDTGTGVSSLFVTGQASGATAVTVAGTTWTTTALGLAVGGNALVLTATDGVGNVRTLNITVNVNIPASSVIITSPSNNSTLTRFDTLTVRYTIDGVVGSQLFNLSDGSNSLVVSSSPNASGNVGRDTVIVVRDGIAPNAPTLTAGSTPTRGTATWTWTSQGDNSGGGGVRSPAQFQYQLNNGTWVQTNLVRLDLGNLSEGSYGLIVQEQDRAGNWSANSTLRTIVIDRTGPVVTIVSPSSGWITNEASVSISWTEKDGPANPVSRSRTFNLNTDNASNNIEVISDADAAGNTGTASISIWRRSNVIFVESEATGGDGSSWTKPLGNLQAALAIANSTSKKQIWVRSGTYKTTTSLGFQMSNDVAIYGGFGNSGTPNGIAQRDSSMPYRTVLTPRSPNDTLLYAYSSDYTSNPVRNIVVNSVRLEGHSSNSYRGVIFVNLRDFQIKNCEFTRFVHFLDTETTGEDSGPPNLIRGNGRIVNCTFRYNTGNRSVLELDPLNYVSGTYGVTIAQSMFSDNGVLNPVVNMVKQEVVESGLSAELNFIDTQLLDYVGQGPQVASTVPYQEAVMTFKNCVVRGGQGAIMHGGTLNYDSSNKEP